MTNHDGSPCPDCDSLYTFECGPLERLGWPMLCGDCGSEWTVKP